MGSTCPTISQLLVRPFDVLIKDGYIVAVSLMPFYCYVNNLRVDLVPLLCLLMPDFVYFLINILKYKRD